MEKYLRLSWSDFQARCLMVLVSFENMPDGNATVFNNISDFKRSLLRLKIHLVLY